MDDTAKLFVIAAPSGAGKTTLVKALLAHDPELRFSVSYTTRQQRKNEIDGRDYFFVSRDRFLELQKTDALLESALVFDNYYGTSRAQVEEQLQLGHNVILEIDWQGARQVRESMPGCVTVFILPPSRAALEHRLRSRRTDSDEVIARRLRDALSDMQHYDEFDYIIINDELDRAIAELHAVLRGEGEANRADNPALLEQIKNILV
jgi:guanylate kinase